MSGMGMGRSAAIDVMQHVQDSWPKIDLRDTWGDVNVQAFLDRVERMPVSREQAVAALTEWRMKRVEFPDPAKVLQAIYAITREAKAEAARRSPGAAWRETPEQRAEYERGVAEARAWAESASGEEITAAREALERLSRGRLACPPTTRRELLANPGRCVSLFAAQRMATREVLA